MEGRISREHLAQPREEGIRQDAAVASTAPDAPRSPYAPRRNYRTNYYSSRRNYRTPRRTRSPYEENSGVLVQLFASGILLLFVLFVALVDSDSTIALRSKLQAAFSQNATVEELAESTTGIKNRILGNEGAVNQLFGGESSESPAEAAQEESASEAADIDSLLLEQLAAEEAAKND